MHQRLLSLLTVVFALALGSLTLTVPAVADNCPEGLVMCEGACFDPKTSIEHCGACGVKVRPPYTCLDGRPALACPRHQLACGDTCVSPARDALHCGGCGNVCRDDQVCRRGTCQDLCPRGQKECDGACKDLQIDWTNCGACGKSCRRDERCSGGKCVGICMQPEAVAPEKPPVNQYKLKR